jgi:hypothetical protein
MSRTTLACPVCGCRALLEEPEFDEWLCPDCEHTWPGEVVRGERMVSRDNMAVRDDNGGYTLYELCFVDDPDNAKLIELRSGLSRAEAEQETSNVHNEPPGFGLLG